VIFGNVFSCGSFMGRYSRSLTHTHTLAHNPASAVFVEVHLDDRVFISSLIKIPTCSECFLTTFINYIWQFTWTLCDHM